MEPRPFPLEGLHDAALVHVVRAVSAKDSRALALTCKRLCHLVRFARTFALYLNLAKAAGFWDIPASRAFQHVCRLSVAASHAELQQGGGERLAETLARALERWEGIQEVKLSNVQFVGMGEEEPVPLEASVAVLKGARGLRRLTLSDTSKAEDLHLLQELTQVTSLKLSLLMDTDEPPPMVVWNTLGDFEAPLAALKHLQRLNLPSFCSLTGAGGEVDEACPLALPPKLTFLSFERMYCQPGAFWRHIAACKDLCELHLGVAAECEARAHPSWGLQQLSSSLRSLTRLVMEQPDCDARVQPGGGEMPQLMQLLYGAQNGAAPQAAAAAAAVGQEPLAAAVAAAAAGGQVPPAAAAALGQEPPAAAAMGQEPPAAAAAGAAAAAAAGAAAAAAGAAAVGQEPAAAAAAAGVVQAVQAPTAIAGLPAGYAATYLMVPPPGLSSFASLKVLQLPSHGMSDSWGLVCSAPHHWTALAGCTALQQLEGLHASQLPPAGVKFPGVTRLEVAVAPGDVLGVLAAFPALRELKVDAVIAEGAVVGGAAAEEEEEAPAPDTSPDLSAVTHLTLDFNRFRETGSDSLGKAAGAFCQSLWEGLPSIRALEVVWPAEVALLQHVFPLSPRQSLTLLVLRAKREAFPRHKEIKDLPAAEVQAAAALVYCLSLGSRDVLRNMVLDLGGRNRELVLEAYEGILTQLMTSMTQLQLSELADQALEALEEFL